MATGNLPNGFLHLADLIELQRTDTIFSTPDSSNDVLEQMEKQNQKDEGVTFDLRLGKEYYLSGNENKSYLGQDDHIRIQPGQFALLTTYEIFHLPRNLVGFISLRFKRKAEGLINVSGFQVDPGYNGLFIFSIYNAGPKTVRLPFKDNIFTILFSQTSRTIANDKIGYTDIPLDKWDQLVGTKKISLTRIEERVSKLEVWKDFTKIIIPIAVGGAITATIILMTNMNGGSSAVP